MNENDSSNDQHDDPVGPEIDDTANPTEAAPEDARPASEPGSKPRAAAGREMLIQLQQMIDTLALQAGPVMREVAAKAAELAAVAGEKAGPVAHRAAAVTESVGQRVAARSKEMATDLRRPRTEEDAPAESPESAAPESPPTESSEHY